MSRSPRFITPAPKLDLSVLCFLTASEWETWLDEHASGSPGAWLKFAKQSSSAVTLSRLEAVEVAICFGWIDGQLDKLDETYWLIKFTPRRTRSKWSEKSRDIAIRMMDADRVRTAGRQEIESAKSDGRWASAYAPQSTATVPPDLQGALDHNPTARAMFDRLDASNRYAILYRLHTAARPETRSTRLSKYVGMLERGETIHPLKEKPQKGDTQGRQPETDQPSTGHI